MPVKYSTPKDITTSPKAAEVICVGINIRLPGDAGEAEVTDTVTFYFEARDSDGNVVDRRPVTVPVADIAADPDFNAVYAALKRVAYANSPYPEGTVE